MRIKIDFYVNENFKFNKNLNEAMTAFIYRCISLSDKRYGAMLHDKGYRQCGYKKFVYHVYSLSQNGSCVKDTLNRGMATLILSSTLDKTIIHFTRGLIRIGKVQLLSHTFDIISIKNIDEPKYTNSMMAKIKSPIFLQDVNHRYLKPGNMEDKLVNNLLEKYYSMYGDTLVNPTIALPEKESCKRLPGTDGKAKMSKSIGNCIYLSDDSKTVTKKVMTMFTDPTHLKITDKGHTKDNPVFIYLDAFCKDDDFQKFLPDFKNLDELKHQYEEGGLGDVTVKKFLADVLNETLEPFRIKRKEYEKNIPEVYRILEEGSKKAEAKAHETVLRVRRALSVNYFEDTKFIEKQAKAYKKKIADEEKLAAYLAKQKKN